MEPMLLTLAALEGSVQTGDERNVVLWLIIALVAFILIVVSAVLSIISKKK